MKDKFFETVKKIDCALFLLAFAAAAVFLTLGIAREIKSRRRYNKKTQVAALKGEDDKTIVKETTEYLAKSRDVHVFAVKSNAIKTQDAALDEAMTYSSSNLIGKAGKGGGINPIVNLIFARGDGADEKRLFSENVFIERYSFERREYNDSTRETEVVFPKNAYAVIERDDNGDGVLSADDFVCLYISDYDGGNLKKLAGNICFCRIEEDALIFADYKDGEKTYRAYDSKTGRVKKIKSSKESVAEKQINLW